MEAVQIGRLLFLSGMLPVVNRKAAIHRPSGRGVVGGGGPKGRGARRPCSALAAVREHLGSLDKVTGVAKLGVSSQRQGTSAITRKVADGASGVPRKVLGPEMPSGRIVLGVASLPLGLPVEVELVLEAAA